MTSICHKMFLETLWQQLKPLYLQLHAYVRRELRKKYGENIVSKDGPIPAHLLGNMWAQSWSNIANFTTPYPGKQMPDVTDAMIKQGLISIYIKIYKNKSVNKQNLYVNKRNCLI